MPTIKEQCENRIRELVPETICRVGDMPIPQSIELTDIFKAMKGHNIYWDYICTMGDVSYFEMKHTGETEMTYADYDISKDFDQQEESFYSFLLEIIK